MKRSWIGRIGSDGWPGQIIPNVMTKDIAVLARVISFKKGSSNQIDTSLQTDTGTGNAVTHHLISPGDRVTKTIIIRKESLTVREIVSDRNVPVAIQLISRSVSNPDTMRVRFGQISLGMRGRKRRNRAIKDSRIKFLTRSFLGFPEKPKVRIDRVIFINGLIALNGRI